ncbi:MAG: hypothetical protein JXA52_07550 [Planctomycetes bacterium]|nr:hypothetical protein [Planctomycetota bacterium]
MTDESSNLVRNESTEMVTPIPFQFDDIQVLAKRLLEKANTQAQRVLEAARKQAKDIEKAAYEDGYQKGYEESLAKGLEEGRVKGKKEARGEILDATRTLAQSLETILAELSQTRLTLRTAAEVDMLTLAIAIAEKIVRRTVALDNEVAKANALAAVELIIARRDITLRVSPEDFKAVQEYLPTLKQKFDDLERVTLVEDKAVGRGGIKAVTLENTVDLSTEKQLQAIVHSLLGGAVSEEGIEAAENILEVETTRPDDNEDIVSEIETPAEPDKPAEADQPEETEEEPREGTEN